MTRVLQIGSIQIGGGNPLALVCGPCVIEDEKTMMAAAEGILTITEKLRIPLILSRLILRTIVLRKELSGPWRESGLGNAAAH
jgi:2-dehydro-3-deoxyphosphooctonate aldolase (KDO 8-P synthase)